MRGSSRKADLSTSRRVQSCKRGLAKNVKSTRTRKRFGQRNSKKFFIQNLNIAKKSHLRLFSKTLHSSELRRIGFQRVTDQFELETNFLFNYGKQRAGESKTQKRVKEAFFFKKNLVRSHQKTVKMTNSSPKRAGHSPAPSKQDSQSRSGIRPKRLLNNRRRLSVRFIQMRNFKSKPQNARQDNINRVIKNKARSNSVFNGVSLGECSINVFKTATSVKRENKPAKPVTGRWWSNGKLLWLKSVFCAGRFLLARGRVHVNKLIRLVMLRAHKVLKQSKFIKIRRPQMKLLRKRILDFRPARILIKGGQLSRDAQQVSESRLNQLLKLYFSVRNIRRGSKLRVKYELRPRLKLLSVLKLWDIPSNLVFLSQNRLKLAGADADVKSLSVSKLLPGLMNQESLEASYSYALIVKSKSSYFFLQLRNNIQKQQIVLKLYLLSQKNFKIQPIEKDRLILKGKDMRKIISKLTSLRQLLFSSSADVFLAPERDPRAKKNEPNAAPGEPPVKRHLQMSHPQAVLDSGLYLILRSYFYIESILPESLQERPRNKSLELNALDESALSSVQHKKKHASLKKIARSRRRLEKNGDFKLCLNNVPAGILPDLVIRLRPFRLKLSLVHKRLNQFGVLIKNETAKRSQPVLALDLAVEPSTLRRFFYFKSLKIFQKTQRQIFPKSRRKLFFMKILKKIVKEFLEKFSSIDTLGKLFKIFHLHLFLNSDDLKNDKAYFFVLRPRKVCFDSKAMPASAEQSPSPQQNSPESPENNPNCDFIIQIDPSKDSFLFSVLSPALIHRVCFLLELNPKFADLIAQNKHLFTLSEIGGLIARISTHFRDWFYSLVYGNPDFFEACFEQHVRTGQFFGPTLQEFVHWLASLDAAPSPAKRSRASLRGEFDLLRRAAESLPQFLQLKPVVSEIKFKRPANVKKVSIAMSSKFIDSSMHYYKKSYFVPGQAEQNLSVFFTGESLIDEKSKQNLFIENKKHSARVSYMSILNNLGPITLALKTRFSKNTSQNTINLDLADSKFKDSTLKFFESSNKSLTNGLPQSDDARPDELKPPQNSRYSVQTKPEKSARHKHRLFKNQTLEIHQIENGLKGAREGQVDEKKHVRKPPRLNEIEEVATKSKELERPPGYDESPAQSDFLLNVLYKEQFLFGDRQEEGDCKDFGMRFLFFCEMLVFKSCQVVFKCVLVDYREKAKRLLLLVDDHLREQFFFESRFKISEACALFEIMPIQKVLEKLLDVVEASSDEQK